MTKAKTEINDFYAGYSVKTFTAAFNYISESHTQRLAEVLNKAGCGRLQICGKSPQKILPGFKIISGYGLEYGQSLSEILECCENEILVLVTRATDLALLPDFAEWIGSFEESDTTFSYSAHNLGKAGSADMQLQPCIDYQTGSVRDDFDFGPIVLIKAGKARELLSKYPNLLPEDPSALYGLRLACSLQALPLRFSRPSYTAISLEDEDSHKAHFAYASSSGAANQKALERTFTEYARSAGFYISQPGTQLDFASEKFPFEASVIIPVRNRAGKVEHAVRSALNQKTSFSYNVIVVDNHSSDGTTAALAEIGRQESKLLHLVPERKDLGIGGCWQLAVDHEQCGCFAVQLDSDDLYSSEVVLQRIVDEFYHSKAAAVVGSYLLVDRDLKEIPPGAIEHREWSDANGHNNALRINGFGAPRAYYTPVIRKIGFPNVSYGEDYAAMLAISREYKIARIYEYLYLCRRWEGNSDAAPSIEKMNGFHQYKDSVRTAEIGIRKVLVAKCGG